MMRERVKHCFTLLTMGILVLIGSFIGSAIIFSSNVFAGNKTGASGSLGTPGGSCSASTGTHNNTYCGQFGVSWRYYSLTDSRISHLKNIVNTCTDEDTDGVYILAYELVDVKDGGVTKYHKRQYLGNSDSDSVFVQVNEVNKNGGWKKYLGPNTVGSEAWDGVKEKWEYYKDAFDSNVSWGSTTWFCGDEDPEPRVGIVKANSGINVNGVPGDKVSAEVGPSSHVSADSQGPAKDKFFTVTVQTSQPQISGSIWHNMAYENVSDGWSDVKKKAKKYKGITLDTFWDVADGDVDAGAYGYGNEWKIPAKETTDKKEGAGRVGYTVNAGNNYCHTLTYEPVKFKFNNSEGVTDEAGRAHTTACVTVNHVDKPKEPSDEFWATSSVQVPNASAQLGGYDPGKQTSDKDAAVGLKVSTDSDSLQFTLSHNMDFDWTDWARNMWRYWDGCISTNADGSCNGDWVYVGSPTKLSYELSNLQLHNATLSEPIVEKPQLVKKSSNDPSGGADVNSYVNDIYPAGADKDTGNGGDEVSKYTYTISGMEKGKTYKVCHKIKYDPKTYTTPITESLVWTGPWSIGPQWNYDTPVGSGSEDSEACIEITRPEDPPEGGDPDPYGPKNGGDNASDIMYAGEHTGISWKVAAKSVPTRRVKDYSAIGFVVRDDVTDASVVNAGGHVSSDPCDYFRTKSGGRLISFDGANCAEFSGDGLSIEENTDGIAGKATQLVPTPNNSEQDAFTQPLDIAVPDNVGGKYCNSYGYKWGYWWGVAKASDASGLTDDIATWTYVTGKDYWTIYSATCRTIAKKPSFAVWNGSLFSGAGVSSSTALRHNEANNGQPTKLNNDSEKTTYGSWAENIVVAQNEVSRFASSGAYGAGIPGLVSGNQWDMAWQTITNMGLVAGGNMLGNSGINYNSSYSTRLSAYLKSHATNTDQEAESYGGATGVGDTQILYFNPGGKNGTLTISGNVELANTSGKTIYEMPQVVIYVDGNVKIAPSVTRLDAWIIANGNVDTCDGWVEKTTETQSVYRNQNTACDNRLQINGPVVAKSVTLNRTYGADPLVYSGTGKYTSSEVFNLSALSYLWSFAQAGRYDSSYTDVYSRELAPRY